MEESQHAKLDTLLVDELARNMAPGGIDEAFEDFAAIGAVVDGGLQTKSSSTS